jgi:uncharacterized tellurite resistance protein B-like protein
MTQDTAARVLAAMTVANGRAKECEFKRLEELHAFARLGITRERFVALTREARAAMGKSPSERGWLSSSDLEYLERLLIQIEDRTQRLLVCRLTAAVVTADGCVSAHERAAYEHMLACWHVTPSMVAQAILADPVH